MPSYEKRNNKWTIRFRLNGVNKRLSGFDTKKAAEAAYLKEKNVSIEKVKAIADITVEQLAEQFKEYKKLKVKESSYIIIAQTLDDHILPYFRKFRVSGITPSDVVKWQNKLNETSLKYHTKSKIHLILVNLMSYAIEFCGITINPASKAGGFKNNELRQEMQFWTESEFEQFIKVVDDLTYKTFFSTLYLTGARKGEVMALTWEDVNFNTSAISISKTYTNKVINGGYKITQPKTRSSIRQVLVPTNLVELLRMLQSEQTQYVGYSPKCFVFGFSRPLAPTVVDRRKREACTKAGVKEIRIHDFRHSHASLLLNKEQNIMLVAQRLGHSDINMTLNTYSHLFPNRQKELIASLDLNLNIKKN